MSNLISTLLRLALLAAAAGTIRDMTLDMARKTAHAQKNMLSLGKLSRALNGR
jgi:hypothetical protein